MGYDPYENYYTILEGNMIKESLCIPKRIIHIIITILFPPLGMLYTQFKRKFDAPGKILLSLILTTCFYLPGLIYGLNNLN
jgi:uncharacterized membrane protein YqaE (UPF0057 family)